VAATFAESTRSMPSARRKFQCAISAGCFAAKRQERQRELTVNLPIFAREHLDAKPNDLERYNYLIGESDWNERTIANPSLKASLRKSNERKIEILSKPR
jgi:hypothetical protein